MAPKFFILISLLALLYAQGFMGSPVKKKQREEDFVKKVHVIFMNHLDAGYSLPLKIGYLVSVMHMYWYQYFPKAAYLAQKLRDEGTGETFVYTTQPWLLLTYFNCPEDFVTAGIKLQCPDEAAANKMREAILRGDITWHAGPMNMQHEFANQIVYKLGLNISNQLDTMFDITHAAKVLRNTDVPGLTQAVIPQLLEAGITGVSVGTNGGIDYLDVPKGVFRWVYPNTGQEVLATWHLGGYPNRPLTVGIPGGLSRDDCVVLDELRFPEALCFAFKGDNLGPPASTFLVKEWYQIIASQFPDAEIFGSTLGAFFAAVNQVRDQLPLVTKEIGDHWIDGVASDPRKTAEYRAVNRALETCFSTYQCDMMDARLQASSPYIVKMFEHTWGVHRLSDISQGDPYQVSVNSWLEQREMLNFMLEKLEDHPLVETIHQELSKVHSGLDFTDYQEVSERQFQCGENRDVVVGFSAAGHVNLLDYKGVIWATSHNSIGEIIYQTQGPSNSTVSCSFNSTSFSKRKYFHSTSTYQKQTRDDKVFWPTTLSRIFQRDVDKCEFISEVTFVDQAAHTDFGAPSTIYLSYRINEELDNQGLHVDVHWTDKSCTLTQEATFVKFNFSRQTGGSERSDWKLDKLGVPIDPYNVAINGTAFVHSVDTGVGYTADGHALWLGALDSPLISWITETQGPFAEHDLMNVLNESISAVAFNLHNNDWTTNYIYWYPYLEADKKYKARFFIRFLQ